MKAGDETDHFVPCWTERDVEPLIWRRVFVSVLLFKNLSSCWWKPNTRLKGCGRVICNSRWVLTAAPERLSSTVVLSSRDSNVTDVSFSPPANVQTAIMCAASITVYSSFTKLGERIKSSQPPVNQIMKAKSGLLTSHPAVSPWLTHSTASRRDNLWTWCPETLLLRAGVWPLNLEQTAVKKFNLCFNAFFSPRSFFFSFQFDNNTGLNQGWF